MDRYRVGDVGHAVRIAALCKLTALALCGVVLFWVAGGQAQAFTAGTTAQTRIESRHTGITYHLYIYLPADHKRRGKSLPVVYVLDGDSRFEKFVDVLKKHRIDAALVGIHCIDADRRWVDFTMPGARKYYRFLTEELIPFVEKKYRLDSGKRLLSGHSLSGNFVLYALLLEDPVQRYFSSYLSADGAYWYQQETIAAMEKRLHEDNRRLPVTFVLSGAENLEPVIEVYQHLTRRRYDGLHLQLLKFNGQGHVEMDAPAFKDSLEIVFGKNRVSQK